MTAQIPAPEDDQGTEPLLGGVAETHPRMHGRTLLLGSNLLDWGADPTGVTPCTSILQDLIDSVPASGTAGVPAHTIWVPEGTFTIDDQIDIHQKAVIFRGMGVGNPTNYATPGKGSTFQWDGAEGGCMFNVQDTYWTMFEDLLILGNVTNPPNDLIYFQSAGGTLGTNEHDFISRCLLGSNPWANPATWQLGDTAVNAVRFGGMNANNDQFHFSDTHFAYVGTGVKIDNTQSVWGLMTHCYFDTCSVAGLQTASSTTLTNPQFIANAVDLVIDSTAKVHVSTYNSENAGQIAHLTTAGGGGGYLNIDGGLILVDAGADANMIQHDECIYGGGIMLKSLTVDTNSGGPKGIHAENTDYTLGTIFGSVSVIDCFGIEFEDLDIAVADHGDPIDVLWLSKGQNTWTRVSQGETLSGVTPDYGELHHAYHTDVEHLTSLTDQTALTDDFNRANSNTTMGTAVTGQSWLPQFSSVWGIDTNKAYKVSNGISATPHTYIDSGTADMKITADMFLSGGAAADIQLLFRAEGDGLDPTLGFGLQKCPNIGLDVAYIYRGTPLSAGYLSGDTAIGAPLGGLTLGTTYNVEIVLQGTHITVKMKENGDPDLVPIIDHRLSGQDAIDFFGYTFLGIRLDCTTDHDDGGSRIDNLVVTSPLKLAGSSTVSDSDFIDPPAIGTVIGSANGGVWYLNLKVGPSSWKRVAVT